MTLPSSPISHANNFALLRLLFASLVVLAHSPEILDGNRSRELATSLWGTVSFGTIAVDGFFLVSGYLVTMSFEASRGVRDYLKKRVLRIFPGFIAASLICVLVFGPLGGAAPTAFDMAKNALKVLILAEPHLPGVFSTLPFPAVNGPMWTIAYEFRCYLLIGVLGAFGLLRHRAAILSVALLLVTAQSIGIVPTLAVPTSVALTLGEPALTARLAGCFLIGASFYLFRDRMRLRGSVAAVSIVSVFAALFIEPLADLALATLGAYAVFWFAFNAPAVGRFIRHDVSYGLYLYAWPISSLLYYRGVTNDPWTNAALTLLLAAAVGFFSWLLIEKPALRLKGPRADLAQSQAGRPQFSEHTDAG